MQTNDNYFVMNADGDSCICLIENHLADLFYKNTDLNICLRTNMKCYETKAINNDNYEKLLMILNERCIRFIF